MDWLPPSHEFRARLAAAKAIEDAADRLEALSLLADARLSFLETIQLDAALAATPQAKVSGFETLRLAVLAASTVDHLLAGIRVAGLRRGLRIEGYAAGFGQYRQELFDPRSPLQDFKPNVVLIALVARELIGATPIGVTSEEADGVVAATVEDMRSLWRKAREGFGAMVVQQSLLDTSEPIFGSLDAVVPGVPARLVACINAAAADAAYADGVLWLDVARASARDGLDAWFDVNRWLQAKMEIAPQAAMMYGELTARLIAAARGKYKKCLVLDLDNTLWGGVIGDDGIEGIVLGKGSGVGEAFLAVQAYAKTLSERGVLLAVCSKNDPALAEAAFRDHPEMLLKRADFAAFVANWTDKAENLVAIARTLNIGLDSLVFVDDNPVERARVREALPMVAVPELPADPARYVRCIARAGLFEATAFTQEDLERGRQYGANAARENFASAGGGIDAFLEGLEMSVEYGPIAPLNLARVTQLINKTNQFNTTTIRRAEHEVEALIADPDTIGLQFRLIDKFGDNGIVSVMILSPAQDGEETVEIINWVMSCRVFGRQLEDEVMNIAVDAVQRRNVKMLRGQFIPTKKNGVIRDLFANLGFGRLDSAEDEGAPSFWGVPVADYIRRPTRIARKEHQA